MNRLTPRILWRLLLALCVLSSFVGCASTTSEPSKKSKGKHMVVRTTAYTHTEAGGSNNAIGSRSEERRVGKECA